MGLGLREIARSLNISHSTVKDQLSRADLAGLSWPLPEGMDDVALKNLLFPGNIGKRRGSRSEQDFAFIHKERRRKGVTLALLWEEYNPEHFEPLFR